MLAHINAIWWYIKMNSCSFLISRVDYSKFVGLRAFKWLDSKLKTRDGSAKHRSKLHSVAIGWGITNVIVSLQGSRTAKDFSIKTHRFTQEYLLREISATSFFQCQNAMLSKLNSALFTLLWSSPCWVCKAETDTASKKLLPHTKRDSVMALYLSSSPGTETSSLQSD